MKSRPPADHAALVVRELTLSQSLLYAYVYSLVGSATAAADVLQETNLVLWQKRDQYDPTRPFLPWAHKVAYFQVLAYRKRCQRDRLVLDDELLALVPGPAQRAAEAPVDLELLDQCLSRLTARARQLIDLRYARGQSLDDMAKAETRNPNAVAAELYRIRKVLVDCVRSRLLAEPAP